MDRINVYEQIDYDAEWMRHDETPALLGWFDYDSATKFAEETEWDGHNHISVNTGSQWDHETLLRTAGGRWVLRTHSNRQGVMDGYRFLSDEAVKDWLLRNHADDIVEHHFGAVEPERGPGRPEVGNVVNVRLGDLLGQVDAYASENGLKRAEAVRVLLAEALSAGQPYTLTVRDIATGVREIQSRHATLGGAVEALRAEQADDAENNGLPSSQPRVEHDGRPVDVDTPA